MLILLPTGLFEFDTSGLFGRIVFVTAFDVLSGLAGAINGWYRLGSPAAEVVSPRV